MDGSLAIERNRVALTRIVAALIAMAGLVVGHEELAEGYARGSHPGAQAEGGPRRTLPRHLWLAILRLLRPAEAAARRLVIAAARGVVVPPPRLTRSPSPVNRGGSALRPAATRVPPLRSGVAGLSAVARSAEAEGDEGGTPPRRIALPLFDPLRRVGPRRLAARDLPRICVPGWTERRPVPVRIAPSPDDPIDATRLGQRLAALAAALDNLPRQALRFARLKARLDAPDHAPGRFRRISPLRGGPPPGGRLARYEPDATHRRRNIRKIDEILAHAHDLALYALERPDTS